MSILAKYARHVVTIVHGGVFVCNCTACDSQCNQCIIQGAGKCDENKCKIGFGLTPTKVCDRESRLLIYKAESEGIGLEVSTGMGGYGIGNSMEILQEWDKYEVNSGNWKRNNVAENGNNTYSHVN